MAQRQLAPDLFSGQKSVLDSQGLFPTQDSYTDFHGASELLSIL